MSAKEQVRKGVRSATKPIIVDLAKRNVLSLSIEIVSQIDNQTFTELSLLKPISNEPETSKKLKFQSGNVISMECASNKPLNIFNDKSITRQNMKKSNPV